MDDPADLLPPIALDRLREMAVMAPPEENPAGFLALVAQDPGRLRVRSEQSLVSLLELLDRNPGPRGIAMIVAPAFRLANLGRIEDLRRLLEGIRRADVEPHPFTDEVVRRLGAALRIRELDAEGRLPDGAASRLIFLVSPARPFGPPPAAAMAGFRPVAAPGLLALRDWLVSGEPALWAVIGPDFDAEGEAFDRRAP